MLKSKSIFFFLLSTCVCAKSFAQDKNFTSLPTRGEYSLVLYAGGGAGYYGSSSGAPAYLQPKVSKWNPVGTVRIMWHPDHLLKFGVESGYLTFYSYTLKDTAGKTGKISLDAIPVLLEWSMSLNKRINVFAGSGLYFLKTRLNYAGKTNSNKLSVGWMAAASYIQPLSKDLGLGSEIKWLYASETTIGSIVFQVQLVYKFLKW